MTAAIPLREMDMVFARRMSGPAWTAATDRVSEALGLKLDELALRLGYSTSVAIYRSRRSGAPAYMAMALRAVAAEAPCLPEELMQSQVGDSGDRRKRLRYPMDHSEPSTGLMRR
jgi:hypothetical protein